MFGCSPPGSVFSSILLALSLRCFGKLFKDNMKESICSYYLHFENLHQMWALVRRLFPVTALKLARAHSIVSRPAGWHLLYSWDNSDFVFVNWLLSYCSKRCKVLLEISTPQYCRGLRLTSQRCAKTYLCPSARPPAGFNLYTVPPYMYSWTLALQYNLSEDCVEKRKCILQNLSCLMALLIIWPLCPIVPLHDALFRFNNSMFINQLRWTQWGLRQSEWQARGNKEQVLYMNLHPDIWAGRQRYKSKTTIGGISLDHKCWLPILDECQ